VLDAGALRNVRKQGGSLPKGQALKGLISLVRATAKRARNAEVIYANTQRAMVIGAIAGKLARRPVVWHLRDIVSPSISAASNWRSSSGARVSASLT
jgi:hypothetical protein